MLLIHFFQNQTILDDSNAILPELPPPSYNTQLNRIILTPLEVESILKTLKPGNASGPNGLSNRVLKNFLMNYHHPFALSLTSPCTVVSFLQVIKMHTLVLSQRKATYL